MKVKFVGVGTVTDARPQSCILVENEDIHILVDIGCGSMVNLQKIIDINKIDAILITHHHLDHNGDLLNFLKTRYLLKGKKVLISGPKGTYNFMKCILNCYPYLLNKVKYEIIEETEFSIGKLEIKPIRTIHSIRSVAYMITNGNKSIIISGDTIPLKYLLKIECDLLIHEMSLPFGAKTSDHTTPETFAEILKYCKSKTIYLTHMYPQTEAISDKIIRYLSKFYSGKIEVAREFNTIYI